MADNDKKRFYWLKLKKDFFQQHQIKILKSLPNGRLYALIYLELLAESTSHDGELRYSKMLPYDIITLSAVIDEDKDNVEKAIETLINLELVEVLDDGTIFMREIERLIGSETGKAERMRDYRERKKLDNATLLPQCSLENRDKSSENRDKNIYSKRFVPPTLQEVRDYCEERNNNVDYKKFYEYYSIANWKDSKGNPVKNWKQKMIANWEKENKQQSNQKREDILTTYDTSNNPEFDEKKYNEIMARRKKWE